MSPDTRLSVYPKHVCVRTSVRCFNNVSADDISEGLEGPVPEVTELFHQDRMAALTTSIKQYFVDPCQYNKCKK